MGLKPMRGAARGARSSRSRAAFRELCLAGALVGADIMRARFAASSKPRPGLLEGPGLGLRLLPGLPGRDLGLSTRRACQQQAHK